MGQPHRLRHERLWGHPCRTQERTQRCHVADEEIDISRLPHCGKDAMILCKSPIENPAFCLHAWLPHSYGNTRSKLDIAVLHLGQYGMSLYPPPGLRLKSAPPA